MLKGLFVKNYILIEELNIAFNDGFTVITGETGAGKSILLGALNLLLGKRAELKSLMHEDQKCIIEGTFQLDDDFRTWFENEELDYYLESTIRREITPNGKSRSFINDTPVSLQQLKGISPLLFDIHAQHQSLQLKSQAFKLGLIDGLANQEQSYKLFRKKYKEYTALKKEYNVIEETIAEQRQRMDYVQFQLDELEALQLNTGELNSLEIEQKRLTNSESLQQKLSQIIQLIDQDDYGVIRQLYSIEHGLNEVLEFIEEGSDLNKRIRSSQLELNDISASLQSIMEESKMDPERLLMVNERLSEINHLLHKHQLTSEQELIEISHKYRTELKSIDAQEGQLKCLNGQIKSLETECDKLASQISKQRQKVLPILETKTSQILQSIGIPRAIFKVKHQFSEKFDQYGRDEFVFMFSANAGVQPEAIEKIASGGELSRLMLVLKSLVVKGKQLPTMIFDEIDSGISGEIAIEVGKLLKQLSANFQLLSISHLPQIAALADHQYLVYKAEFKERTHSHLKKLNDVERVEELAKMIGGKNFSETAKQSAKELLAN